MKTYTRDELWAFVWRAETPKQIHIAEEWIARNVKDYQLWEDLQAALVWQSVEYYRRKDGRA